jgi:hypothetical protein
MSISYDPDEIPDLDLETIAEARRAGLKPINVICIDPEDADRSSVQVVLFVETVPRLGERIILQDEKRCQVVLVVHKIVQNPFDGFFSTMVTVVAQMLHPPEPQT